MIKIIDPTMTKVIDVSGTPVTIRPLTPNQRRKAYLSWGDLRSKKEDSTNDKEDSIDDQEVGRFTVENVDRDGLAALVAPAVIKIEGYEDKNSYDLLVWMEDVDFWQIVFEVLPYTGMTEDERKNSGSSSVQDTQEVTETAEISTR